MFLLKLKSAPLVLVWEPEHGKEKYKQVNRQCSVIWVLKHCCHRSSSPAEAALVALRCHTWLSRLCQQCWSALALFMLFWQAAHTFLRKEHIQGKKNNEFKSMELLKNKVQCPLRYDNNAVSKASSPVLCTAIAARGCQLSLFRNSANGLHYFFKQSSEIRLLNRTRGTSAARDCHMVWIEAIIFPPLPLQHQGVSVLVHYQGIEMQNKCAFFFFLLSGSVELFSWSRAEVKYSVKNKPHKYKNIKETIACSGKFSHFLGIPRCHGSLWKVWRLWKLQ